MRSRKIFPSRVASPSNQSVNRCAAGSRPARSTTEPRAQQGSIKSSASEFSSPRSGDDLAKKITLLYLTWGWKEPQFTQVKLYKRKLWLGWAFSNSLFQKPSWILSQLLLALSKKQATFLRTKLNRGIWELICAITSLFWLLNSSRIGRWW